MPENCIWDKTAYGIMCFYPHLNLGWGWCTVKPVLSPPVKYFTDRSKAVLLLWIFYYVFCLVFALPLCEVCLYVPCGHLLGKGWPLDSRLWCLTVSLLLSHWYPGSGVVLDCIDSWSLHPYCLSNVLHIFDKLENIVWASSSELWYLQHRRVWIELKT